MGNGIIFILIVIGVIVLLAVYQQGGWEGYKSNPADGTIESVKTIGEGIKTNFEKGKELIDKNNQSNLTEIGQIPCAINEDCNILTECVGSLCICEGGSCFK